jgi:hypothetical protein
MTTPSKKIKIEPTQISDEDLKDKTPNKTMSRRITSAFKKSFSKTLKRTPSKTYKFNKEEDFKDESKFSNDTGVASKNNKNYPEGTVLWSIILRIDPDHINPKIKYTDPELMEAVTMVLKNGKTLDRKYGKTTSDIREEELENLQNQTIEAYLEKKRERPEIKEALKKKEKKNGDAVLKGIQASVDAEKSKKQLAARLKKLNQGGRSRRRMRKK